MGAHARRRAAAGEAANGAEPRTADVELPVPNFAPAAAHDHFFRGTEAAALRAAPARWVPPPAELSLRLGPVWAPPARSAASWALVGTCASARRASNCAPAGKFARRLPRASRRASEARAPPERSGGREAATPDGGGRRAAASGASEATCASPTSHRPLALRATLHQKLCSSRWRPRDGRAPRRRSPPPPLLPLSGGVAPTKTRLQSASRGSAPTSSASRRVHHDLRVTFGWVGGGRGGRRVPLPLQIPPSRVSPTPASPPRYRRLWTPPAADAADAALSPRPGDAARRRRPPPPPTAPTCDWLRPPGGAYAIAGSCPLGGVHRPRSTPRHRRRATTWHPVALSPQG